jgi:hypothetical protein
MSLPWMELWLGWQLKKSSQFFGGKDFNYKKHSLFQLESQKSMG